MASQRSRYEGTTGLSRECDEGVTQPQPRSQNVPMQQTVRVYLAAICFCSSKIGRKTERQIVPTTMPMTAIMIGSMRLVSCLTVALTWSS